MPAPLYKKLGISKEELKCFLIDKHHNESLTQREISNILNCDNHTIMKWMKKLNIKVKLVKWDDKNLIGNNKRCRYCGEILNISQFRDNRNGCINCEKKYGKTYFNKNRNKILKVGKNYRDNNKEKERLRYKKYDKNNRIKRRTNERKRYNSDINFRIRKNLRSRLLGAFNYHNINKQYSSKEYGINFKEIINYLGPKPSESHTIDHIIPLSLFDFSNKVYIQAAFLPENHQWMLGSENCSKGNKIINNERTLNALSCVNDFLISNGLSKLKINMVVEE